VKNLLKSILGDGSEGSVDPQSDASETQGLRLELQEARGQIESLKAELERAREGGNARGEEARQNEREALAQAVATPLSQVLAQKHLLDSGAEVAAKDVAAAARSLVKACLSQGLELVGEAGAEAAFDPARHAALSGGTLEPGQAVRVRFVGLATGGRVVKKAAVEEAS